MLNLKLIKGNKGSEECVTARNIITSRTQGHLFLVYDKTDSKWKYQSAKTLRLLSPRHTGVLVTDEKNNGVYKKVLTASISKTLGAMLFTKGEKGWDYYKADNFKPDNNTKGTDILVRKDNGNIETVVKYTYTAQTGPMVFTYGNDGKWDYRAINEYKPVSQTNVHYSVESVTTREVYRVFHIIKDTIGNAYFLVYSASQGWSYEPARNFIPVYSINTDEFKVYNKETEESCTVYDIDTEIDFRTKFLVFDNNAWKYANANKYTPVTA